MGRKCFTRRFKPFKAVFKYIHGEGRTRERGSTLTIPGNRWTEMESSWKETAGKYYRDGLRITDIAVLLEVSRQSVSAYLKAMPDYDEIKEARRRAASASRRKYKTEKQRVYRSAQDGIMAVTAESMRREHELAVMELSREKYH